MKMKYLFSQIDCQKINFSSEKISFSESTMFFYGLTLNLVEKSQKNFLIILGAFCISVQYRKAIFNEFPLSRQDHPKLCFE